MLSRAIDAAAKLHGFDVVGFVYMPEHVHLIVFPITAESRVSSFLYAIKRPHAYRAKNWLKKNDDARLRQLVIRERPGKHVFRFWQEGSGYDRHIESGKVLTSCLQYIYDNPVRRGLCDHPSQWPWSSWHHYFNETTQRGTSLPQVQGLPVTELLS